MIMNAESQAERQADVLTSTHHSYGSLA